MVEIGWIERLGHRIVLIMDTKADLRLSFLECESNRRTAPYFTALIAKFSITRCISFRLQ